jgi:microcystin-dependent protein
VPAKLARSNIYSNGAASDNMSASAIAVGSAGGGQPVDVRNPFVGLNYCIAIQGIFPSRD